MIRRIHAVMRAKERYGVDLMPAQLAGLAAQCREGKAVLLLRIEGSEHRIVLHQSTAMIAVYDRLGDKIITFLPPRNDGRAFIGSGKPWDHRRRIKRRYGGTRHRSEGRRPETPA